MQQIVPYHGENYTNFHDLNLTWILQTIETLQTQLTEFVSLNTIKYADPFQWNITRQYAQNTLVINPHDGTVYISTKPIPTGVQITDTNYWTPVFSLKNYMDVLKTAITRQIPQQENGSPATKEIPANSIFFVENILCKNSAAIPEGTLVVIGTNCEQISVMEVIESLKKSLELSISEIQKALNQETENRENADTELQNKLNQETENRKNADTELQNKLEYLGYYANITEYGAVPGNTDSTSAFTQAAATGKTVIIPSGSYAVNGSINLNNVIFTTDAIINAGSSASITIKNPLAGRTQIFAGTLTAFKLGCNTVFPEWFGAKYDGSDCQPAFTAAIAAMSPEATLSLYSGTDAGYTISTPAHIEKSRIAVIGYDTAITFTNNGMLALTPSNYTEEILVQGLKIRCNSTPIAIDINNTTRLTLRDIIIIDPIIGVRINNSVNTELYNVTVIDQQDKINTAFLLGETNASVRLFECNTALGTVGTSYSLSGTDLRDIMIDHCESAGGAIGVDIPTNSNNSKMWDVWINNSLFDNFKQHGILYNYHKTAINITIRGCWFAAGQADVYTIELNSPINITIDGCQFGTVQAGTQEILLNSPTNVSILNNQFLNPVRAITISNGTYCNILNNIITITPDAPNYSATRDWAMEFNSVDNTIVNNTLINNPSKPETPVYTAGIKFTGTCTNCQCQFTAAQAATTPVDNQGGSGVVVTPR